MRSTVGGARRAAWRLFLAYGLASLLPLLALAAALVQDSRAEAVERGLEQGSAPSVVVEEMAVAPALAGGDLRDGLSPAEHESLQRATDLAVFSGSVVRMRLRDFRRRGGRQRRRDDRRQAPARSAEFQAATRGDLHVVVQPNPVHGRDEVIRPLQPVMATVSGRRGRARAVPALRRDGVAG